MKTALFSAALLVSLCANLCAQSPAVHFSMTLDNGKVRESISNNVFTVASQLPPVNVQGVNGEALRFDGYSNYLKGTLPITSLSTSEISVQMILAAETYPMMNTAEAENTPSFATICGNLDEGTKKGFAFELSSQGDIRFRFGSAYANGYLFTINGTEKLARGRWSVLTAVLSKSSNSATLYLNGTAIGTSRMSRSDMVHSSTEFHIGKDATEKRADGCLINTFCGLIDEIAIYNEAMSADQVKGKNVSEEYGYPDFNYPSIRYKGQPWRPQFHGMPSGGWTNECHGMIYSGGKYHLFFQKNANGPYMARLHWGHISSENLYDWQEEPIAIGPGESYDIKGCWSGCLYEDGGHTNIAYTAVDNAKAVIAHAVPLDDSLTEWEKKGVIINGRPSGLSDDFRDPFFFKANGNNYIIVGTSKNNVGACTLHKYENGTWTNDGTIFFQGGNVSQHGRFWEMPTVTPMEDGKWLFTCTPLNTGVGVRTLCWTGTISADGKFIPDGNGVQYLEMGGISRDGYGLLSPTIYRKDGKTILLGIVPDKLPTQNNVQMGWAHNYSLPREISLDSTGKLTQKPYSGLSAMRTSTSIKKSVVLNGQESLDPVIGLQIELLGEFTVGGGEMGFHFLKDSDHYARLAYNADKGTVTLDLTSLDRTQNDNGVYNGIYSAELPQKIEKGEKLILHVYFDGSIADIFVNDKWAFSVRIFPNGASQLKTAAFSTEETLADIKAWTLDPKQEQTDHLSGDVNEDGNVDISDIVAVINQIAGTATYTYADVNGDSNTDISDIVAIINIIAGQ